MRGKAKVNDETKVSLLYEGQPAEIRIDRFSDRPMRGTSARSRPSPRPFSPGPSSDISVYYAMVNLDTRGFGELPPGLSARVKFFVDAHRQ